MTKPPPPPLPPIRSPASPVNPPAAKSAMAPGAACVAWLMFSCVLAPIGSSVTLASTTWVSMRSTFTEASRLESRPGSSLVRFLASSSLSSFSTEVVMIFSDAVVSCGRRPKSRMSAEMTATWTAPLMTQAGSCFFISRSWAVSSAPSSRRMTDAAGALAGGAASELALGVLFVALTLSSFEDGETE